MATSHNESENLCSPEERMKAMEETIAYLQKDNSELKTAVRELKELVEQVATESSLVRQRVDSWPFVKVAVK
jgi:predicted RNase H-like nuclease (RuvC/YqgF family)